MGDGAASVPDCRAGAIPVSSRCERGRITPDVTEGCGGSSEGSRYIFFIYGSKIRGTRTSRYASGK